MNGSRARAVYRPYDGSAESQRGLLVIGGSGELGSALVRAAAEAAETPTVSGVRAVWATYRTRRPSVCTLVGSKAPSVRWFYLDTADRRATSDLIQRASTEIGPLLTVVFCAVPKHGGAAGPGGDDIRSGIVDHVLYAAEATKLAGMVEGAERSSCRFVAISTDQVFDGVPPHPPYTTDAPRRPLNPYGHYKVEMEDTLQNIHHPDLVIARTSLILTLGMQPHEDGKAIAFLRSALIETHGKPLVLFTDEIRNMSWSNDLAEALVEVATAIRCERVTMDADTATVIHLACPETTNRFALAQRLLSTRWSEYRHRAAGRITPGLSAESGLRRPLDLTMDVTSMAETGLVTRTRLRSIFEYLQ